MNQEKKNCKITFVGLQIVEIARNIQIQKLTNVTFKQNQQKEEIAQIFPHALKNQIVFLQNKDNKLCLF